MAEPLSDHVSIQVVTHSIDQGAADRIEALGFIEQTIYANEDSPGTVTWRNDEVLGLLRDIAERVRREDGGHAVVPEHPASASRWVVYERATGVAWVCTPATAENAHREAELAGAGHIATTETLAAELSNAFRHGRFDAIHGPRSTKETP